MNPEPLKEGKFAELYNSDSYEEAKEVLISAVDWMIQAHEDRIDEFIKKLEALEKPFFTIDVDLTCLEAIPIYYERVNYLIGCIRNEYTAIQIIQKGMEDII